MRTLKSLGGRVVPGRFRFKEPDPSQTFTTFGALLQNVRGYREANGIPLGDDLQGEIEDWLCCEIVSPEMYCKEDGRSMPRVGSEGTFFGTGYQGQKKWKQIHEWALGPRESVVERERWLNDFAGSLPCGDCRRGWRRLVKENPPNLAWGAEMIWTWTFRRHNDIREKLGQPLMDAAAARHLYPFTHE